MGNSRTETPWDAIVIGTGMGGATIGYRLASQGFRVLFLEKGRQPVADVSDGSLAETPEERLAAGHWPDRITAEVDGAVSELFAPLGCGPGGSTLIYGAALERFERSDLEAVPRLEHPTGGWPISYDAMRPYYELAERLYRVQGTSDPLGEAVDLLEPPQASTQDELFMRDFRDAGLHPYRLHVGIAYQPGCQECLGRLCPSACKSTARSVCLDPALERYGSELLTDCEVTRLIATGDRVTSVEFRRGNSTALVAGRVVILAAGTYRSATLLLQSAGPEHPNGLGNGSGLVGRNLMFHASEWIAVWPRHRGSSDGPRKTIGFRDFYSYDGKRLGSVQSVGLSATYGNILVFLYAWFDTSWLARMRPLRPFLRIAAMIASKLFGAATIFAMILEDFGEPQNRIVPDPERPERIRVCYRANPDLRQRASLARRLLRKQLSKFRMLYLLPNMINFGHPSGTCRFGHDPTSSVLDPSCRSHEVKNLYVVDGSFMPSCGGTNPGLTIAANALRVGDAIGRRLLDGEI
jgi:choline dehydrogenase-like flavoprotein